MIRGFNCAAPFRERLSSGKSGKLYAGLHGASIVPPPFGSGYGSWDDISIKTVVASIVPPPFGSDAGQLTDARGRRVVVASIVPPPFGSGYRRAE